MNNKVGKKPGIEEELPAEQPSAVSPKPEAAVEEPVPEEIIESPAVAEELPESPQPEEAETTAEPEAADPEAETTADPEAADPEAETTADPEATDPEAETTADPEAADPEAETTAEPEASPDVTAAPESEDSQELGTELIVEQEAEDKDLSLSPPLFAGCLLGACLVGVLLSALIGKVFKKLRPKVIKASKLRSLAVHGLGARSDQQDACYCSDVALYPQQGLLMCVADGMGGLSNGSIYSRSAVSAVAGKFSQLDKSNPEKLVSTLTLNAVAAVNRIISPNFGSGGTTLLIGYIQNGKFFYSSVGDSRICLYRDGALFHLNRPHDYEADLMLRHVNNELSFEQVKTYEKRGALTSYLGMGALRHADMAGSPIALRRGDRVVLMSDGVFNTLSDAELCSILSLGSNRIEQDLAQAIEGKQLKYQDNYTAVILAAD